MGDERYYRDAPRFQRRDPLTTWSIVFLVMGAGSVAWMLLVFFLTAGGHVAGAPDEAFGLAVGAWVIISSLLVGASILGLLFTILARLGRTQGGGYLSTMEGPMVTARPDYRPPASLHDKEERPTVEPAAGRAAAGPPEGAGEDLPTGESGQRSHLVSKTAARVESTNGPDGRLLLSYTVPEDQPRGLYGDTYVPVDSDAILNVKILLAKTPNA